MNYLFTVMDVYDKEPIGDYYGLRCRAEEAVYSLEEAVKTRFGSREPVDQFRVSLRVDQGSQYLSKKFKKRAKALGVKLEYCGIRGCDLSFKQSTKKIGGLYLNQGKNYCYFVEQF